MKFGVVQFPGSCDERDALAAARRVGDAELLWHADADLRGADAVIIPGSRPASHRTWNPLQTPSTSPPSRAKRSTSSMTGEKRAIAPTRR